MKRALLYIAAAVMACSCEKSFVDTDQASLGDKVSVAIAASLEEQSRVVVTPGTTADDPWITDWEEGDKLYLYNTESGAMTEVEYNHKSGTFNGELLPGNYRAVVAQEGVITEPINGSILTANQALCRFTGTGGDTPLMVSTEIITIAGEEDVESEQTLPVIMKNLCTGIDLQMKFKNLPAGLKVTGVEIESDGVSVYPYTSIAFDITKRINESKFSTFTSDPATKLSITLPEPIAVAADGDAYSVHFGMLPFVIAAGGSIKVKLIMNYMFEMEGVAINSAAKMTFVRGQHHYISKTFDCAGQFVGSDATSWFDPMSSEPDSFEDETSAGTADDPTEIRSVTDLIYLTKIASGMVEGRTTKSKHYVMTGNIDLGGKEWFPIGDNGTPFQGTFDGGSFSIQNLNITKSVGNYQALFGAIECATIKNLTLEGGRVEANSYSSPLVGYASSLQETVDGVLTTITSKVENCVNNATFVGSTTSNFVGGLVGFADGVEITKSFNNAEISGANNQVGGIVGASSNVTITGCNNTGAVSGSSYVGGIAGTGAGLITQSTNSAAISASSRYVGGVVGYSVGQVNICSNTGSVSSTAASVSGVGGVVGYASNLVSEITNSSNTGAITVNGGYGIGGVVGMAISPTAIILNNYNQGTIASGGGFNVGGIVGIASNSTALNLMIGYNCGDINHSARVNVGRVAGYITTDVAKVKIENIYAGDGIAYLKGEKSYQGIAIADADMKQSAFADTLNESVDAYNSANTTAASTTAAAATAAAAAYKSIQNDANATPEQINAAEALVESTAAAAAAAKVYITLYNWKIDSKSGDYPVLVVKL